MCFLRTDFRSFYSKMDAGEDASFNYLLTTKCPRSRDFISLLRNSYFQENEGKPHGKRVSMW